MKRHHKHNPSMWIAKQQSRYDGVASYSCYPQLVRAHLFTHSRSSKVCLHNTECNYQSNTRTHTHTPHVRLWCTWSRLRCSALCFCVCVNIYHWEWAHTVNIFCTKFFAWKPILMVSEFRTKLFLIIVYILNHRSTIMGFALGWDNSEFSGFVHNNVVFLFSNYE